MIHSNRKLSKPPATIPKCDSGSRSTKKRLKTGRFATIPRPSESTLDSDLIRTV